MAAVHNTFESWFGKLAESVYRRKYLSLILVLLLTAGLASQIPKITIDTRDEGFFYDDDPALIAYNNFRDQFGQDDTFIIALQPKNGLDLEFFETLFALHKELESQVPNIEEIKSLVNGRIVRVANDTLCVEELMEQVPRTTAEVDRIIALIKRYPLYEDLLVSKDRSLVSILIKAQAVKQQSGDLAAGFGADTAPPLSNKEKYLSNEESIEITNAIEKVLARYQDRGVAIHFSGTPAIISILQKSIMHDMSVMIPLSFSLIVIFLIVLFRRVSGLIYPLVVVTFSLLASLGTMAVLGIPITLVSQMIPSFLLVVGIADSIHILTIFYRRYRDTGDKHQAIVEAIRFAGLPVLMTSVTTACGVLSFIWADVATVAQLGYITPIGVMLALVYTVVLLPALIAIFPVKRPRLLPENTISLTDRIFTAIARVTTQRPLLIVSISAIIVACALAAAMSVRFSHNALNWFPEDSEIRIATQLLDSVNGGSVMLEAVVDTGRDNGLHEPDTLKKFARATAELPGITVNQIKASKAWSLADVLKETNRALHEDRDTAYRVPDSRELIAQELLLFEGSGSDDLEDFTDINYRIGRISLLAPFADAILYKDYVDSIKAYLQNLFPNATITLTGKIPLFVQLIKNVVTSLAKSYVFALLVITLLMIFMVGRVRIGLLSMVANVAPIIGVLGLMGIKHIPLDLSTMLIGSLVLGLIVDDTIHFLHHFRRAYEKCNDVEQAVRLTLFSTGRAMVITSCVLAGGFFIYTTAYLESNVRYGLLNGCAVVFALIADFYLVPALLSLVYGKRKSQSCPAEQ
jgi:predicted RND superfamily exporter protein